MPYLGQILEKEGDLPSESSPRGGYLVRIVATKHPYLPVTHCVRQGDRGICKGMVHRIVPQVWGLVPLGHINSPPISHQAQGIGSRAFQGDTWAQDQVS